MNRVERDYCSKGRHPRWKAWTAHYENQGFLTTKMTITCDFCGARVKDNVAWPAKDRRVKGGAGYLLGRFARLPC